MRRKRALYECVEQGKAKRQAAASSNTDTWLAYPRHAAACIRQDGNLSTMPDILRSKQDDATKEASHEEELAVPMPNYARKDFR